MATTLFFSAFMSAIVWFFVLAGNTGSPGAWIYSAFLVVLFFRMLQTGEISRHRRVFLVNFAVFFAISFIGIMIDERGTMAIAADTTQNSANPFCHIIIPAMAIPYAITKTIIFPARMIGHFASVVMMLLYWFIATITIGRGWCSWVCFYGGWEEGASRLAKKSRIQVLSRNRDIRAFQFAFFIFIILVSVAFLSSVYCEWFCPFKIVTEFSPVVRFRDLFGATIFIAAFLGLVIVMPILTRKRFQCSAFCPFGAFQSLVDRVSGYRIKIDTEKCTGCLKCATACQFCAIDRETIAEKKGEPELTCAKCGECIAACPSGAISYEFKFAMPKRKLGTASDDAACKSKRPEPSTPFGRFLHTLLEPKFHFVFSAYTFGVVMSSRFVPDAIGRIIALFTGGM